MPIYEYECCNCKDSFEVITLSNVETLPKCPKCDNTKVKKLISCVITRPDGIPKGSGGFDSPCSRGGG